MLKYKVAIIEDISLDYDLLREKIEGDAELIFCKDMPCTKEITLSEYLSRLLESEAQIFFVDWEL